jgi:hypothetical protein
LSALSNAATWGERDWLVAAGCYDLLQHDLAAYTLLAFGAIADRARYILHPEHRAEMAAAVRSSGGVGTDDGQ